MEKPFEDTPAQPLRAAAAFIRERQEDFPPWTGRDRIQGIFAELAPTLTAPVLELYRSGSLAVGEVGEAGIRAKRENLGNNEYAVELYSGLMEFFGTVCLTIASASHHTTANAVEAPVLGRAAVVQAVAKIFTDWRAGAFAKPFKRPDLHLGENAANTAAILETNTELFVIAHELGHITMESMESFDNVAPDAWGGVETYADLIALRLLIRSARLTGMIRSATAGALVAVRVFGFLERMGVQFDGTQHPPPQNRLEIIKHQLRIELGSDLAYTRDTTVAMSFDEDLEGVENVLFGQGNATKQTAERVGARLWAILEVAALKLIPPEKARRDLLESVKVVPEPVLQEVAANYRRWLLTEPRDPALGKYSPLDRAMSDALKLHLREFPEPAKSYFLPS